MDIEKFLDLPGGAIARIRDAVFDFLITHKHNNYVLTNNLYEDDGDRKLYEQVKQMASRRGSLFVPVRLLITEEEHLKRITQLERRARWKSIDPQHVYDKKPLLKINDSNLLELDVSILQPEDAAKQILMYVKKLLALHT